MMTRFLSCLCLVTWLTALSWFTAALVALLVDPSPARSAPVPSKPTPKPLPEKKPTPKKAMAPHVGTWDMEWRGVTMPAGFREDGSYWCSWHGRLWLGTWTYDGNGNVEVTEYQTEEDPTVAPSQYLTWSCKLNQDLTGVLSDGGTDTGSVIKLTPPKPKAAD